ncbi:MAG: Rne/Rng family ribonuclease [Acidobacteriaceae bacterium]
MTKEIYISSTPHETRLAVVEDDQLAEIYYERENEYTLAGSVYKGKVTRVLPGMQSAFVDIGLERDAFLYITDFAEEQEDGEEYVALSPGQLQQPVSAPPRKQPADTRPRQTDHPQGGGADTQRAPSDAPTGSSGEEETGPGARRWRGRRGRRRGRSGGGQQNVSVEPSVTVAREDGGPHDGELSDEPAALEPDFDTAGVVDVRADQPESYRHDGADMHPQPSQEPFREQSSRSARVSSPIHASPMVLPGESLSKYRGAAAAPQTVTSESEKPAKPAAAVPTPTFQPPTMVVGSLAWDGSGLLPGESLSRYKNKPTEQPPAASSSLSSPAAEVAPQQQESAESQQPAQTPVWERVASDHSPHLEMAEETDADTMHRELEAPIEPHQERGEFEPTEGSASYRFDPSKPSAYRQNFAEETQAEEPAARSAEESYPVIAPQPAQEAASDRPIAAEQSGPAPAAEPFFSESVSIAPHHDFVPAHHEPETSHAAEATPASQEDPASSEVKRNETEALFQGDTDADSSRAFDPGHGHLEEEMLDEEEAEAFAAQAMLEEAEYDDLVEETLDVQMDSGLLSELVRDKHIDQRTRYVDEPGSTAVGEDSAFEEEDALSDGEPSHFGEATAEIEFEDDSDMPADEEDADGASPEPRPRTNTQRSQRRGTRGQQRQGGQGGDRRRMRRSTAQTSNLPAITELLKPNQEILVQIAKEPIARKGARITSHIALPGRFLVFMPTVNHVGVSRKIASDEERQRLKRILLSEKGTAAGGFIVRTAATSASEEDLRADIRFLLTLWAEMRQRAESSKPPALIYHDLSLVERVLRDQVTDNFSAIWVDSEADYERVLRFLNRFEPALVRRVKLYTKETPLFEQFGIQEEINKALRSKVWLKSGGSIVINQTEALVAIDINTGKYVGKTARLEDTIVKTNLDAIPEIVRQIRLRDLGGIIVIDFIDMDERKNRNKVMQALEEALKADRAPSKVLQFNDFGLVAITRKRVKQSLERTLSVPCSTCTGTGMVKGPLTVCNEIYIELRKMHRQFDRADVMLRVHPEVVKQLKVANGRWLSEMEEMSGKTIIVKSDAALHPEQFDIH